MNDIDSPPRSALSRDPLFSNANDYRQTPWRRFVGWRWWRGWRGWLIFTVVAAVACTAAGIALAKAFSDPAEPWSQFPGVPQVPTDQILENETIEQLSPRVDAAMRDVREAITAEFGFTWVPKGEDRVEYESNRFHGTSLLNTYDTVNWQTTGTLRTVDDKNRAIAIVSEVMERHGFEHPELLNSTGPEALPEFGGFTLKDQGRWVLAAHPSTVSRGSLDFTILDLSHDRTNMLTQSSNANIAAFGWEPEYLSIAYHGDFMLKASDKAEFEKRAAIYAGHIQPVPGRNKD